MFKTIVFHKSKNAKVLQHICTKGPDLGDYYFTVVKNDGTFIDRFGNRLAQSAILTSDNL